MTATLGELEARIAELEAQVGQPAVSTLQPNVLTVKNGIIGAIFPGGVTIAEQSSGSPINTGSLNFTDLAGAIVESVVGYLSGGQHIAQLASTADAQAGASLRCYSVPNAGPTQAGVQAIAQDETGDVGNVVIVNAGGQSNFVQLPAAQKLVLGHGASRTDAIAGGTANVVVNHGLASAPVLVWTSGFFEAGFAQGVVEASPHDYTATQFTARIQQIGGAGTGNVTWAWAAFG